MTSDKFGLVTDLIEIVETAIANTMQFIETPSTNPLAHVSPPKPNVINVWKCASECRELTNMTSTHLMYVHNKSNLTTHLVHI